MTQNPTRFGQWTVVCTLGNGGMATAFLVARRIGGRVKLAALKTPSLRLDEESYAMFRDEASLACYLDHPNIVRGIEFDSSPQRPFLVMDYVDGPSLDKLCTHRTLSVATASFIVCEVAKALDHIHNLYDCEYEDETTLRPMHVAAYHRDCTLGNIFASIQGAVKLGDLGIAFCLGQEADRTGTIGFKANPAYLSPSLTRIAHSLRDTRIPPAQVQELARARDAQTKHPGHDIYILGETFFRLLHNQPPFADHAARKEGNMRAIRPELPEAVRKLLLDMLAMDPADRPSARDVFLRLRDAVPDSALAADDLASEVQRYLCEDSRTLPASYEVVPPYLRSNVHLRARALHALTEQEHDEYLDDVDPTPNPAPSQSLPPPRSRWSTRYLAAAATAILGVGAVWAFDGRQATRHPTAHTPNSPSPTPPATLPRSASGAPQLPPQGSPTTAAAAPTIEATEPQARAAQDSTKPPSVDQAPAPAQARRRSRTSEQPSEPFCELLILDTVDYSNEALVDGRKARPLQLPGQSSLPVGLGNHVVTIQRRNELATKKINVRTKKDCKVQF